MHVNHQCVHHRSATPWPTIYIGSRTILCTDHLSDHMPAHSTKSVCMERPMVVTATPVFRGGCHFMCNTHSSSPLYGKGKLPSCTHISPVRPSDSPRGGLHSWLVKRPCIWTATIAIFSIGAHNKDHVSSPWIVVASPKTRAGHKKGYHICPCLGRGAWVIENLWAASLDIRYRTSVWRYRILTCNIVRLCKVSIEYTISYIHLRYCWLTYDTVRHDMVRTIS